MLYLKIRSQHYIENEGPRRESSKFPAVHDLRPIAQGDSSEKRKEVKIKSRLDRGCERRKGPNVEVGK
jgi:hypothetical protein